MKGNGVRPRFDSTAKARVALLFDGPEEKQGKESRPKTKEARQSKQDTRHHLPSITPGDQFIMEFEFPFADWIVTYLAGATLFKGEAAAKNVVAILCAKDSETAYEKLIKTVYKGYTEEEIKAKEKEIIANISGKYNQSLIDGINKGREFGRTYSLEKKQPEYFMTCRHDAERLIRNRFSNTIRDYFSEFIAAFYDRQGERAEKNALFCQLAYEARWVRKGKFSVSYYVKLKEMTDSIGLADRLRLVFTIISSVVIKQLSLDPYSMQVLSGAAGIITAGFSAWLASYSFENKLKRLPQIKKLTKNLNDNEAKDAKEALQNDIHNTASALKDKIFIAMLGWQLAYSAVSFIFEITRHQLGTDVEQYLIAACVAGLGEAYLLARYGYHESTKQGFENNYQTREKELNKHYKSVYYNARVDCYNSWNFNFIFSHFYAYEWCGYFLAGLSTGITWQWLAAASVLLAEKAMEGEKTGIWLAVTMVPVLVFFSYHISSFWFLAFLKQDRAPEYAGKTVDHPVPEKRSVICCNRWFGKNSGIAEWYKGSSNFHRTVEKLMQDVISVHSWLNPGVLLEDTQKAAQEPTALSKHASAYGGTLTAEEQERLDRAERMAPDL